MPNYKCLKTYSKTQKEVNFSTLFDKEPFDFDSSSESIEKNDPVTKKVVDKENIMPKKINKASVRGKKKDPMVDKVPSPEKVQDDNKVAGKRKAVSAKKNEPKEIKLFQITNMDDSSINKELTTDGQNDTCADIENQLKAVDINQSPAMTTKATRGSKKTLKSSNSVTNLKTRVTTRSKANEKNAPPNKENNLKVETKKRGIKKSKSTSNVLTSKKAHLIQSNENKNDLVNEVSQIRSIMKSRTEDPTEEDCSLKDNNKKQSAKTKKAVKILVNIDDKNDQLTNFKIDNRTKHAAQTSTPSGLRRKPLKISQEISMIVTPNQKDSRKKK